MRKFLTVISIAAAVSLCCLMFVACDGVETPLAAPTVRLDGDTVGWSAVDNAARYDVYINGAKTDSVIETHYTVVATTAGDHEVKVKAIPSKSEYAPSAFSNAVVYTAPQAEHKLASPEVSGSRGIIEWEPIAHATSYEVYLSGEKIGVTSKPWYILPDLDDGDHEVKVAALSSDPAFIRSDFGTYVYHAGDPVTVRLATPEVVLTGNVAKWEPVPHAESYDVYVNGALKVTSTDTEYAVTSTAFGKYAVTVVAKSTDELYTDSLPSSAVVYEIKRPKLAAPQISLSGNTVSWRAVENATSYEIYINNVRRVTTSATSYTISASVAGVYVVKVKAVGNGYDSSDYSDTVEYTFVPPAVPLATPEITIDGNTVSWQSVKNAASYKIYINDEVKTTVSSLSYTIDETETGHYTVKVQAVASDPEYADSSLSNGIVYSVAAPDAQPLASPQVTVSGSAASWSAVTNAQTYDIYADGIFLGSTDALGYSLPTLTAAGDYSITVIAKPADLLHYKNSAPSAPAVYTVQKKPSRIKIVSYPEKEVYFTDEAAAGLDLGGLTAVMLYSNDDGTDPVTLTAANASGYDLTVAGRYEIEFTVNGVISDAIRIYVRERTVADISEYITVVNSYDPAATEYAVTDSSFAATTAFMSNGSGVTVANGKVPASTLREGENLVRLSDGSNYAYALVKVARIITTADMFKDIDKDLNGYYMLGANIDFGGNGFMIGKAPLLIDWEDRAAQKASKVYASRDGVGCEEAPGRLFTGTLDGCGYILSNFSYKTGDGGYSKRWTTSGVALFGGVGKTGAIRNLVLRDFHVASTGACALLAGYNGGLIENICVEEDCTVSYHWDAGSGISAYNYGVVKNCVSHVATVTLARNNSVQPMYLTHFGGSSYEVDNGINGYVGVKDDLTDILGEGWYFIPEYGTYYGNLQYKKLLSFEPVWYAAVPSRVVIFHAKPALSGVYMHSWGGPGGAVSARALSTGITPNTSRITAYECTLGASFTAGTSVTVKVRYSDNNLYFCTMRITVGEPYPISAVADGETEVYRGGIIRLDAIDLTVTLSDGSQKTVHPTGYDESEFDGNAEVGTVEQVTLFYSYGGHEVEVQINVSIVAPPAVPHATSLNITKKSDSVSYGKNSAPDFDGALVFTAVLSDGNTRAVTLANDETLVEGAFSPGRRSVTFTYTDPAVGIQVTQAVEIDIVYTIADKDDWTLMNTYLDGYFELKGDIDLGGVAGADNPAVIGKIPLTSDNNVDPTGVGSDDTQLGVAFTGKFDGNGYKVKGFASDYAKNTATAPFASSSYGLVPFAFVGEGGVVQNFTLDGASIKCGQSGSLIVGLNLGTVRNVVIESNCTLLVHYGGEDTGAIANANRGTLADIVCKVTSFTGFGSKEMPFIKTVYDDNGGTQIDCKIESGEGA